MVWYNALNEAEGMVDASEVAQKEGLPFEAIALEKGTEEDQVRHDFNLLAALAKSAGLTPDAVAQMMLAGNVRISEEYPELREKITDEHLVRSNKKNQGISDRPVGFAEGDRPLDLWLSPNHGFGHVLKYFNNIFDQIAEDLK